MVVHISRYTDIFFHLTTPPFTHRKKITSNKDALSGSASISKSIGKSDTIDFRTDIPQREIIPAASRYCLPSKSNINLRCTCFALVSPSRPSLGGPRILSRLPFMVLVLMLSNSSIVLIRSLSYTKLFRLQEHLYNATAKTTLKWRTKLFLPTTMGCRAGCWVGWEKRTLTTNYNLWPFLLSLVWCIGHI